MSVIVMGGLGAAVFILGLPGRIAIARKHPEAEAVYLMGWVGFLAVVPWIQALGWAFKPTDVIDVRYLPAERKRETDEMIARLTGQTPEPRPADRGTVRREPAMTAALLVIVVASAIFWLVFFKLKLLRLTPGWGLIFAFFVIHLLLVFVIGLRFVTPDSANATVVQRTIQLVPRLPEPTLVTAVLVEENVPVKKGQPLFQFDRRPYEYKVAQIRRNWPRPSRTSRSSRRTWTSRRRRRARTKVELDYEIYQKGIFDKLAGEGAVREEDVRNGRPASAPRKRPAMRRWPSSTAPVSSTSPRSTASTPRSPAWRRSSSQAQYYLDNTTLTAPEDGRIINLQVRPGMVSGTIRVGGIAALIADADRYLLATYYQQNLKYVRPGQPVEVALDLYPGQIFAGKVDSIWKGNGVGQYLPSDDIPKFQPPPPNVAAGPVCGEDHPGRSGPVEVSHRRARLGRDLHQRRTRRLGGAAQDFDARPFLGELALSDEFLTDVRRDVARVHVADWCDRRQGWPQVVSIELHLVFGIWPRSRGMKCSISPVLSTIFSRSPPTYQLRPNTPQ